MFGEYRFINTISSPLTLTVSPSEAVTNATAWFTVDTTLFTADSNTITVDSIFI
jgi:hypothetical protein